MPQVPQNILPMRVLAITRIGEQALTWQLRITQLIPYLAALGIKVQTLQLPHGAWKWPVLLRQPRYHLCWLHRYTGYHVDLCLIRRLAPRLVYDYDDPVGYHPWKTNNLSPIHWIKFRVTLSMASGVLAATDGLMELAKPHCRHVVYSPLCIDPADYAMRPSVRNSEEPLRLIWLGSAGTFQYLLSVCDHLEAIGRSCPRTELHIVGHQPLELTHLRTIFHPWSPVAEQRELSRCHLGLVPLTDDRWTRSKATLKPLQYMASGIPFLGSPVGVNLRYSDDEQIGLLGANPEQWVTAVQTLLGDESRRQAMGTAAVAYIRNNHHPQIGAQRAANLFRRLVPELDYPIPVNTKIARTPVNTVSLKQK